MHVRSMHAADLAVVRDLSAQLGYPGDAASFERRFARLAASNDDALFVAEHDGHVVGWIHVHPRFLLESDPYAEIGALVVDRNARRLGVGRALVARGEAWAREKGFARMRVRSNVTRVESHQFYPALGYELKKTQHTYERALG